MNFAPCPLSAAAECCRSRVSNKSCKDMTISACRLECRQLCGKREPSLWCCWTVSCATREKAAKHGGWTTMLELNLLTKYSQHCRNHARRLLELAGDRFAAGAGRQRPPD